ncbi:MAG: c-type cytochrome domain-containing protein [Prosthecobacter sp.]
MMFNARTLTARCVLAGWTLSAATTLHAADLDFYRDVYPFLKANCISCHNKTTTKADLDMETPEMMKKGGETGAGVVPGKSAESLIVQASLHTEDLEMPPKNNKSGAVNLTPAEIAILKAWIDQGAKSSVQQERQVAWQPLAPGVHPIYSVAMTKDGRLAACGRSNQLFVYDLATRQFVTQIVDEAQKTGVAHRALVQSLAFSPDGSRLASGSYREVKIWRQEKGKSSTRKGDAALGVVVPALTSDGKQIIGADKTGALLVMDAVSGKVTQKIADVNKSGIKLLSVSPDASKVAVYGVDAALSVWSLIDAKVLTTKAGLAGVYATAWTKDGMAIATAGEDKIVRVWTIPTAGSAELAAPKELKGAAGTIKAMAAGATPDQLITAGEDNKVRVWSIAAAKVVREIANVGALNIAVSRDGKQIVTGGADGAVRVWDAETGKAITELRGSVATTQQMAAWDWIVAAQGLEQAFQKTEVTRIEAQNKALDELLKKANEAIVAMKKVLPEKQKLVKPAQDAKAAAQKVVDAVVALIAKVPGGKPEATLEKQLKDAQEKLGPVTMTENSALAAVSAAQSNVKDAEDDLKRITKSKEKNSAALAAANAAIAAAKKAQDKATADIAAAKLALTKSSLKPLAVSFSADAQRVAAIFSDGTLHVWAVASGIPIEQVTGTATTAASLIPSANGTFFASSADSSTSATSAASRWVLERVLGGDKDRAIFADRVNAVRFSPDGKTLATGGGEPSRSGDISLFDVATGKVISTWKERHDDVVLSLDFSPNGKLLASGSSDKIARVTDIATGKQTNLFEGHTHYVTSVAFRADGRVLATAGADGVVSAWNMIMGERKKKIEGWTKEVTSLQFIGATNQIVTSAGDNLVRIVNDDGAEVRALSKLPDFMQSAASTPNGSTIIGGGEDSILRVWDGTNAKEVAVFGGK